MCVEISSRWKTLENINNCENHYYATVTSFVSRDAFDCNAFSGPIISLCFLFSHKRNAFNGVNFSPTANFETKSTIPAVLFPNWFSFVLYVWWQSLSVLRWRWKCIPCRAYKFASGFSKATPLLWMARKLQKYMKKVYCVSTDQYVPNFAYFVQSSSYTLYKKLLKKNTKHTNSVWNFL